MPYTAPAWNAVDFDFTGAPTYTAPAWDEVDFDFSAGGGSTAVGTGTAAGSSVVAGYPTIPEDPYWDDVVLAMHMDTVPLEDLKGHEIFTSSPAARSGAEYAPLGGNLYSCALGGTGSRLTSPTSTDFDFGTGAFTISLWCNPSATSNPRSLVRNTYISGVDDRGWSLSVNDGQPAFSWTDSANVARTLTMVDTLTIGTWNHIEVTGDGTVIRLFLNGVLKDSWNSGTGTSVGASTGDLLIGAYLFSGGTYGFLWDGYIDDLVITKGVARHTSGFTVPTTPFYEGDIFHIGRSFGTSTAIAKAYASGIGASAGSSVSTGRSGIIEADGLIQGSSSAYSASSIVEATGTSDGTSSATASNTYRQATGISAGTSTASAYTTYSEGVGRSYAYSTTYGYTYRDKGAGSSGGSSTARAVNLDVRGTGQCFFAGSRARAFNPYRHSAGRSSGSATVRGAGSYVIGKGRASGSATVIGRTLLKGVGGAVGTGTAQARSRQQGIGVSIGQGIALSTGFAGQQIGVGSSSGASFAYGIYGASDQGATLTFVRTSVKQSTVWTDQ